jgi:hypothetical protein
VHNKQALHLRQRLPKVAEPVRVAEARKAVDAAVVARCTPRQPVRRT